MKFFDCCFESIRLKQSDQISRKFLIMDKDLTLTLY